MRRLWTPRWLLVHAAAVILVIGFLLLCWWQVTRAASGNLLSYGYAIEWPAFAAFVVYVWVKEMRQAVRGAGGAEAGGTKLGGTPIVGAQPGPAGPGRAANPIPSRSRARNEAAYDDSADAELAAYNRYLSWLNAHPRASPSEYPG